MKYRVSILLLILLFSAFTSSQSTLPTTPNLDTQIGILKAANQQKPYLKDGMRVISIENGEHVLVGGNGRYIIKGSLWDMYDGVIESKVFDHTLPALPTSLPLDNYFLEFGNPASERKVYVYIKYNCNSCDLALAPLKDKSVLKNFHIKVMLLHNSDDSYAIARHIYCEVDKETAFTDIFLNNSLPSELNLCDNMAAKQAITLAHSQGINALPLTHFNHLSQSVLGDPNVAYTAAD
jgi:hypothetical protein